MMFPAFSKSKIFSIDPDIVIIGKSDKEPMFDLILDNAALARFGTVLDFQDKNIQVDQPKIVMRQFKGLE